MDIYNVGSRVMNTYIYQAAEGYVMIDTGYEHSLKNVERRASKQGIPLSGVKYVFLTHAHDDHAGFLNELLSKYPDVKVIGLLSYHKQSGHACTFTRAESIFRRLQRSGNAAVL